jgi:hypothetical protein
MYCTWPSLVVMRVRRTRERRIDSYGLAGALRHGRWWAAWPAFHVTTTQPVQRWELCTTVVALLVVDVTVPLDPEPNPMNANSDRRMSSNAM